MRAGPRIAALGALLLAASARAETPPLAPDSLAHGPAPRAEIEFRRALGLWATDGPAAGARQLAALGHAALSPGHADRARILRAVAALRSGDAEALLALRADAATADGAALRGALALLAGLPAAAPPRSAPALLTALAVEAALAADDVPRARRLLRDARDLPDALRLQLSARCAEEPSELWRELAERRIRADWEAPLVAAAALRSARSALAAGESPLPWLATIHRDPALAEAGATLAARFHLDRADSAQALASLAATGARPLLRARLLLDAGEVAAAWSLLLAAESETEGEFARLDALTSAPPVDSLLADALPPGLRLAAAGRVDFLADLTEAALDLSVPLDGDRLLKAARLIPRAPATGLTPRLGDTDRDTLRARRGAERSALSTVDRARAALAEYDLRRALRARQLARLDARLADLRAELLTGRDAGLELGDAAARHAARLDALIDDYRDLLLRRARDQRRRGELQAAALGALDRLRLRGPRPSPAPGRVTVDSVVTAAAALAAELADADRAFIAALPSLLGPERRADWLSHLREGPARAGDRHRALLAALDALEARLGALAAAPDPRRDALAAHLAAAAAERDARTRARAAWEETLARRVIALRRDELLAAAEALDYQLAEAAFLRVQAAGADAAARAEARRRAERFLERHPQSRARAELRFQLAEILIADARESFRARMAEFLQDGGAADAAAERALAPFLDLEPVFELYRRILAEDPGFPRRDALLFNLGMLLDDLGDPRGEARLVQLLAEHPESPQRHRARLRLAERARLAGRSDLAAEHYAEVAAAGGPALARVALYQLAWIRLTEERWLEAAGYYRELLDLEAAEAAPGGLDAEATRHLVECLARAGGAEAFAGFFAGAGGRDYADGLLVDLAGLLRGYGFHRRAAAADSLALARRPLAPAALERAADWLADLGASGESDGLPARLLALGRRFAPGSDWQAAQTSDSLRAAGDGFAKDAHLTLANDALARARADSLGWDLAETRLLDLLRLWPDDPESSRRHLLVGEAAEALGRDREALRRFALAARDSAWALPADWRALALRDRLRLAAPADSTLRDAFLAAGDAFLDRHADDGRAPGLHWRIASLRDAAALHAAASACWQDFVRRWPDSPGATLAAARSGDALARGGDHAGAARRLGAALVRARAAGDDSLTNTLCASIPAQRFLAAESLELEDCRRPRAFAALAADWPAYARVDQALYRAGLGFADCGEDELALAAWTALVDRPGPDDLRADALLRIAAATVERSPARAARALARYSREVADPGEASSALLQAIDHLAADADAAEALRDEFLARFPGHEAALTEILHARALAQLDARGDAPLAAGAEAGGALAAYLAGAAARPALADRELLARVAYLGCLARYEAFAAAGLDGELAPALARKQERLGDLAAAGRDCAAQGSLRWGRAATHLIGRALYEFGDALLALDAPDWLRGDDRVAYLEVLEERAWELQGRGESTWSELVKQAERAPEDPDNWVSITQNELWPRIARRYLHLPEVDYPLVAANAPPRSR